jgi:cell division protein FtsZ
MNIFNDSNSSNDGFNGSVKTDVSIGIWGVGGGGGNAVERLINSFNVKSEFGIAQNDLSKIKFVAANTDSQALSRNPAPNKIQLGASLTKGFGAGGSPSVGEKSAIESKEEILRNLAHDDLTFITCGMGGGTGTGAAPVIAKYLQEMREESMKASGEQNEFANYLKVAVVTTPFHFEGQKKMQIAKQGIEEMKKFVDTLIVVPNQNLFRIANEKTTFRESFLKADEVLCNAIKCISGLITNAGLINVDFADVRYVLSKKGKAVIGIGNSTSGEDRAIEAALNAMSNPILDQVSFKKAKALLVSITGGDDLTLFEIDAALNRISDEVDSEANIIFGSVYDPEQTGSITVSVVATGIEDEEEFKTKNSQQNYKDNLFNKIQENPGIFNYSQTPSYKRVFGVFGGEENPYQNNEMNRDSNSSTHNQNQDFSGIKQPLESNNKIFETNQATHLNQNFENEKSSSDQSISRDFHQRTNQGNVEIAVNEKLQKLGIYEDLNQGQNYTRNNNSQQQDFFENNQVSYQKNFPYNRQDSQNSKKDEHEFEPHQEKKSSSMFSRFISDIPAYLRKKKDK